MVTLNELSPAMSHLVGRTFGGAADAQQLEKAQQQVGTVLRFFEGLLGDKIFFGSSDGISLADVVAGVSVPGLPSLGLAWDGYPKLQAWCDRLNSRDSCQQTQASRELVEALKAPMKQFMKVRAKQSLNNEINELKKSDLNKFPVAIERYNRNSQTAKR
jgi:glutathione S-transferase